MIERKFVSENMRKLNASEYLKRELEKAGVIDVNIQRTTLATRISLTAERPGLVIGKKGKNIKDLADNVAKQLGVENPQIEVTEVSNPALEPAVVARWIKQTLERGFKGRRVIHSALEKVMGAGAVGCEIVLKGTPSKGAIARKDHAFKGYIQKSGETAKQVRIAKDVAVLKQGTIGIKVSIVPPSAVFSDKIDLTKVKATEPAAPVEQAKQQPADGVAKETVKPPEEKKRTRKKKQEPTPPEQPAPGTAAEAKTA
ncbi:30S ribosomal protein S3 [Candidatus Micrarchaeota archaeon]|nr:30S ribosomal protein S3 [Candidatus Micrarchaeota archaeon]